MLVSPVPALLSSHPSVLAATQRAMVRRLAAQPIAQLNIDHRIYLAILTVTTSFPVNRPICNPAKLFKPSTTVLSASTRLISKLPTGSRYAFVPNSVYPHVLLMVSCLANDLVSFPVHQERRRIEEQYVLGLRRLAQSRAPNSQSELGYVITIGHRVQHAHLVLA